MNIKDYIESGVIESYVLGIADAQEAAQLEQLSRQHPEILEAIAAFELSLEKAAMSTAIPPAEHVKERLISSLHFNTGNVQPETPVVPVRFTWMKYIAAASIILLVASASTNIYFYSQFKDITGRYQALLQDKQTLYAQNQAVQAKYLDMYQSMQMMSDPAMVKVSMKGKENNNLATVFWDTRTKDIYLLANRLPQLQNDQQYQLWALVDGKPVDAGIIGECHGLCKLKNIIKAQAFAVTIEKKGGSPVPTLSQLQVIGNV